MARLPTIGGDSNAWGSVQNEFLQVGHNASGTTSGSLPIFNIRDDAYGCKVDGATDDTTGLAAALTAANAAGGGIVSGFNGGTCISSNQTLYPNVHIDLQGGTIKLKNGANTDLFSAQTSSINPSAAYASGINGTLLNFSISNGTLDGNYANQSGGPSWVLRFYGHSYILQNLRIRNGYSGGVLSDWNGPAVQEPDVPDGVECRWHNVHVHDNQGVAGAPGILFSGPHDSQMNMIISSNNSGHNLQVAPNAVGLQLNTFHGWGQFGTGTWCLVLEAGLCTLGNLRLEGNDTLSCLALLSQQNVISGIMTAFGVTPSAIGIKLGQAAGETPIPGQILQSAGVTTLAYADNNVITAFISNCESTNGAIYFDGAHSNIIQAAILQGGGTYCGGFLDPTNQITISPGGLTPDGSVGKGGTVNVGADAFNAFSVASQTDYNTYFNVSTHSGAQRVETVNNAKFRMYSDASTTTVLELNSTGHGEAKLGNSSSLFSGTGVPSGGLGSNGDYYLRTDTPGTANQRMYVKSGGTWSGIL